MLSDEHDDVSRSAGFVSEKKSRVYALTRVGGRDTFARTFTRACMHVGVRQHTHARVNLRSNARVSQSRIADFSHTWFLDMTPFSVLILGRLYFVLIPTIACFIFFSISSSRYSFSSSSNEQPLCNRGLSCTTLGFRRLSHD